MVGNPFEKIGQELGAFVDEKNKAYGSAFQQSATFLELLFPKGIPPEQFQNMILFIRMFDKLKRITTHRDAFGEDPEMDLLGLVLRMIQNREEATNAGQ